ncbi:hypothetical protein ACQUW5_04740 [Legionella sp. CNM-1927-20]|uniref:hypothetical protein n=1 Tax=Legionella sp. CNM-1927-20 TaxID=3422221 RepID=UPI00403B24CE
MSTERFYKADSKFEYDKTLTELETMSEPVNFKPHPIPRKSKILDLFKLIPGLGDILDQISETGDNVSTLVQLKESLSPAVNAAQSSFHGLKLGLAIINFIRIPFIFLTAALLGQKIPLTLSKAGQWAYAGAILVLAALLIALPAAWPIVGLITAGFVLGSAIFTLGRTLYQRHQIKKELTSTIKEINQETCELEKLRLKARVLKEKLKQAKDEEGHDLLHSFKDLKKEYDKRYESLQVLYDKKEIYTYKLAKRNNIAVLDKSVSVILAAGALSGLIVTLFFPPVGLAIAAACAAVGAIYLVSRVLIPFLAPKLGLSAKKTAQVNISNDNIKDKNKLGEELNDINAIELQEIKLKKDHLMPASIPMNSHTDVELEEMGGSAREHSPLSKHNFENSETLIDVTLGVTPEQLAHNHFNQDSDELDNSSLTPHADIKEVNQNSMQETPIPLKLQEEDEDGGESERDKEIPPPLGSG